MPFYDFVCSQCGKVFDRMLSMDRRNEDQVCPACGGKGVRKQVTSFNSAGSGGHDHGAGSSCSGCSGNKGGG